MIVFICLRERQFQRVFYQPPFYKLSSRMPQLPRWRPGSVPLPQAGELAHSPTNSSSTRMPR
jgi:hypothetical protein